MQKHILTVNVEDYFHVWALRGGGEVPRKHWDRLDPRLDANLDAVLDLLDRYGAKATFFVFGCIAEKQPETLQRIVGRGHEIASRGYWPRSLHGLQRTEFIDDLGRAKEALERAGTNRIIGFRSPVWLREENLWMLDALAEEGYQYDSSINPILRRFSNDASRFRIQQQRHSEKDLRLWEFPISTMNVMGLRVTISGGNYIRQLPHLVLSRAVARRAERYDEPVVFYFMPWELDKDQPQIAGISFLGRVRHYRNLAKTSWVLEDYFRKYEFQGIADHLGVSQAERQLEPRPEAPPREEVVEPKSVPAPYALRPVTLVIPIYNEQQNITYLRRTLLSFRDRLARKYDIRLVLVDDGSSDDTWNLLHTNFGNVTNCSLLRHEVNKGVAAALLTGIRNAPTEIVCSIDCDCSYDPYVLENMIPLIDDAEMVTASPYHPEGHVLNVPRWRLFLSKTLSGMYSSILDERIHTYTSCCRIYRKSAVTELPLAHGGFLGVAEMLIELKRAGGRVVEYPATLESRLLGESKMKIVRTISGHLGLVSELAVARITRKDGGTPPALSQSRTQEKDETGAQGASANGVAHVRRSWPPGSEGDDTGEAKSWENERP